MRISIVIPVYNAEEYLRRCLESCLAQTFRDFEVVCVDDGSKDGSGAILDEYAAKSPQIKIVHQANSGVVAARNAAIDLANGEFCYFLDSDDWLPETALADLLEIVDSETDIAFGDQKVVCVDGERVRSLLPGCEWMGHEYVNESLKYANGYVIGKMIRVDICRKMDIETSMCLNEDLLMNIQAGAMARRVRRIAKVNYFYNWVHDGSLSKQVDARSFESVLAANKCVLAAIAKHEGGGDILQDGYVEYLIRNAFNAFTCKLRLCGFEFYSQELRRIFGTSPKAFVSRVAKFRIWAIVLVFGLLSTGLAHQTFRLIMWLRKWKGMWGKYREAVLYCIIGSVGATLDFVVYALLTNAAGLHYQLANFLSVSFGIVNNFFLNRQFNFKTKDRALARLCSFYAVGMFGWALSAGLLWLFIEKMALNALVAKLGTIVFVTIVQFCLNKFVTFRK